MGAIDREKEFYEGVLAYCEALPKSDWAIDHSATTERWLVCSDNGDAIASVEDKQVAEFIARARQDLPTAARQVLALIRAYERTDPNIRKNAKTGDVLKRGRVFYKVITADADVFVIGAMGKAPGSLVDYAEPQIYCNDPNVACLASLDFERVTMPKGGIRE